MVANQPRGSKFLIQYFCSILVANDNDFTLFRFWINFLIEQTNVRYVLCQDVGLNEQAICTFYLRPVDRSANCYQRVIIRVGE